VSFIPNGNAVFYGLSERSRPQRARHLEVATPQIRFRNYLAASRKPFMVPFGMYTSDGGGAAGVDQIEDADNTIRVIVTGAQNGVNTIYGLSLAPTFARVLKNGRILSLGSDYSIASNTLTMVVPPVASDILLVFDYPGLYLASGGGGGGGFGSVGDQFFTAAAGQTAFTPAFPIGNPWVLLNGVKQTPGVHYNVALGTVTFTFPCDAGWSVEIFQ